MVLESLISPEKAERKPYKIIALSFIFVSLGVLVSEFLQFEPMWLMLIIFTVIPSIPFLLNLFKFEEQELEDEKFLGSRTLARHFSMLMVLSAYFIGMTAAFTFWYLMLPETGQSVEVIGPLVLKVPSEKMFEGQLSELKRINTMAGGDFIGSGKAIDMGRAFEVLFLHNLGVLLMVVAFSVVYGAGAVFILTWNASVVGVFIGTAAKQVFLHEAPEFSLITGLSAGVLGLIPHGTFEMLSYLVGALAGGILSSAILRKAYSKPSFFGIVRDVAKLLAWAIVLLAIGAFIESASIAS